MSSDKNNIDSDQYIGFEPETIVNAFGEENHRRPLFDTDIEGVPVVVVDEIPPYPQSVGAVDSIRYEHSFDISKIIEHGEYVFMVMPVDNTREVNASNLRRIGVICRIMQQIKDPEGGMHTLVDSFARMRVTRYRKTSKGYRVDLTPMPMIASENELEDIASAHQLIDRFLHYLMIVGAPQRDDMKHALTNAPSPNIVLGLVANQLPFSSLLKMDALELPSYSEVCRKLLEDLETAIQIREFRLDIEMKTKQELTNQQRENFAQMQIRELQLELGQGADADMSELEERAKSKNWSAAIAAHFKRELKKLSRYNVSSPDYSVQYSYLDKLLSLPWETYSADDFSIKAVEKTLNRDHFGLEKVKERILEQMAVIKLRNDLHAPILCLVGPPGVGKTSLGKSIADAMGREYQRISFGGMHDEAEIRGHRRTYIGAMPGRIIAALDKCKTSNPVIVLDEIDKIGQDFKGDPSSALLEVLDPEQNKTFHDNYIDVDYDLSHVLFIATANSLSSISAPLLDRMEIISLSGYITDEKVEIAKKHLVRKALLKNGFKEGQIDFQRKAIIYMIERYTRESGVRQLEKVISKVLRKIALLMVGGQDYPTVVDEQVASQLLGKEEYNPEMYENNDYTGVVTGLAWTSVGGEILFIESSVTPGDGKLTLTGNLGDVMKESAAIAVRYLHSHADTLGLKHEDFSKKDLHIHVPEGAIPKDGPSAGITMATSVASALTGRKVRAHIAMTGEITLRGKVLPVGGIKEKIIAAKRAGIKTILLSADNRKDIEDINPRYLKGLDFRYVNDVNEVISYALL